MNIKKTLALLALLIAGVVYAWFGEYRAGEKKAKEQADEKRLFSFAPESVNKVRISGGEKEILLEKDKDGWKITSPVVAKGDSAAINGLIETAAGGMAQQFVEGDPADFGLEPATMQVDFYHSGEKAETLLIGSPAPTGMGIYIRTTKTGKVAIVDGAFANNSAKNLYQLRDKHLIDGHIDKINKVEFTKGPASATVMERDKDGNWQITKPSPSPAEEEAVREFIRSLLTATATGFADNEGLKETGLKTPRLKIALWQNGKVQTVLFGGESRDKLGVYAMLEGSAPLILPGALFDGLMRSAETLRDKKIFAMSTADVAGISIQRGGKHLRLIRENGEWHFVVPENRKADSGKVESLIVSLAAIEWRQRAASPDKGSLFAEISLEKFGTDGRKIRVSFSAHAKNKSILLATREDGTYSLDADKLAGLLPGKMEELLP